MTPRGINKIASHVLKQKCFTTHTYHTTPLICSGPTERSTPQKISNSKPIGRIKCTLVPGDGIFPELVKSVQEIFKAAKAPVDFDYLFLSETQKDMSVKLHQVVDSVMKNGICLKGILSNPYQTEEKQSFNMRLRRQLDLFANVVHIKSLPGIKTRHEKVDFIVVREATEGEYSFLEHESVGGVVECLKIVTHYNSRRIAKFAFDYATKMKRKKVTAVHKANIMKLGDGLFLKNCGDISKLYPNIKFENMIIDNCTMQIASNPHQFDVMVMPNLYGDIIDNLGAGIVGGAGVVAGASFSADYAMFEPGTRHTYSEAVGKDIANPTALILCATKMLNHVNLTYFGKMIEDSLMSVLKSEKIRTKDLGGTASSTEFTRAVISNLKP